MGVRFYVKGKRGMLPVFARIRRETEGIDIKVSTRLMVNATDWEKGHKDAVSLTRFRSREPALFEKLDAIERALSSLLDMGGIDSQAAADRIGEIVYAEEIAKEAERERRRQEEENAARMVDLNTYIQRYIDAMRSGERKTESGMIYSEGSIKNKVSFQSEFNKFQKERGRRYDYDDIDMDFYNDFVDFFNRKEYSPNTTGKHIKSIKEIMAAALADGMHTNTQSSMKAFKILSSEADTVYLTRREITDIERLELSGELDLCRDVFLIGVYTAQRYSDYHRIGKSNIIKLEDGTDAVRLTQRKTGNKVVVPIVGKLGELLRKYRYALPRTYSQRMNENIKTVCRMAGITGKVERVAIRGARKVTESVEKYRLVTTHTARRTGATLMYLEGVDALSVMRITGHKTEKEFLKYIRVGEEENASLVAKSKFFG